MFRKYFLFFDETKVANFVSDFSFKYLLWSFDLTKFVSFNSLSVNDFFPELISGPVEVFHPFSSII